MTGPDSLIPLSACPQGVRLGGGDLTRGVYRRGYLSQTTSER